MSRCSSRVVSEGGSVALSPQPDGLTTLLGSPMTRIREKGFQRSTIGGASYCPLTQTSRSHAASRRTATVWTMANAARTSAVARAARDRAGSEDPALRFDAKSTSRAPSKDPALPLEAEFTSRAGSSDPAALENNHAPPA